MTCPFFKYSSLCNDFLLRFSYLYIILLIITGVGDSGNKCLVECNGMLLPEKNTLTSAYEVFCEVTGVTDSVKVYLEKNIPSGAGLGGGSSDAASLINALDAVYGTNLSLNQKRYIAGKVGSDVFFFVECSDVTKPFAAIVGGRGEVVDPIIPRRDLFFVLICPDVHSSTGDAYRLVELWYEPNWNWDSYSAKQLENVYSSPVETWNFINSFTAPLVRRYPLIGEGLQDLKDVGASFTQMSGSGSTVFGVFGTKDSAACAFLKLRKKWKRCYTFAFS